MLFYAEQAARKKIEINGSIYIGGRWMKYEPEKLRTTWCADVRRCAQDCPQPGLHCCSCELELVVFRPWESHKFKWKGRSAAWRNGFNGKHVKWAADLHFNCQVSCRTPHILHRHQGSSRTVFNICKHFHTMIMISI